MSTSRLSTRGDFGASPMRLLIDGVMQAAFLE